MAQPLSDRQTTLIDSLRYKLQKDSARIYRYKVFRPYANIDNRNSFTSKAPINLQGLQVGMIVQQRHTYGLGVYSIRSRSQKETPVDASNPGLVRSLNMSYFTFFYQYRIIDRRYFELDLPFELGVGSYRTVHRDINTKQIVLDNGGGLALSGTGLILTLKPLKWVGVTGSAGIRKVLEKNPDINFDGFYYSYGLWVDLRQIYRDSRFYLIKKHRYKKQIKRVLNGNFV